MFFPFLVPVILSTHAKRFSVIIKHIGNYYNVENVGNEAYVGCVGQVGIAEKKEILEAKEI